VARRVESHHRHRDAARARARARCPARREVDFSARTFRAVWSFSFGSDGADFDGDDSHTAGWAANHDVYQSDGGSIVPLETTGRLLVTFGGLGTGAGIIVGYSRRQARGSFSDEGIVARLNARDPCVCAVLMNLRRVVVVPRCGRFGGIEASSTGGGPAASGGASDVVGTSTRVFEVDVTGVVYSHLVVPRPNWASGNYRITPRSSVGGETCEPPFAYVR
jgi:hypothetical protein